MSRKEQNSNIIKYTTTSNESLNKKEMVPVKTSQSMNTESYEYFSQKKTTKNIITESSVNSMNQNTISKNNAITSSSGLKSTCNKEQKNEIKCTCNQGGQGAQCISGVYGKNLFEEKKISQKTNALNINQEKKGGQLICNCPKEIKTEIKSSTNAYVNSNNTKVNVNVNSNIKTKTNININSKNAQICNCNKGASGVSGSADINKTFTSQSQSIKQSNNQNQSSNVRLVENYSYLNSNEIKSKKINTKITQKTSIIKKKLNIDKTNISKEDWNKRCVGQNNESLQIIAPEKPGLIAQCVQDMEVIQEPRPVQILLPIEPNEIDYPLGLEIYGKAKEEKKEVLICPENIENLNVSKAYSTIVPQFENLNIAKNEDVFCERTIEEKDTEEKNTEEKKEYELMVERNELGLDRTKIEKKEKYGEDSLIIENGEMFVKGKNDFNKDNKAEVITNMNVKGKNKLSWNEMNEAIKTTKMNIDKIDLETNKFDLHLETSGKKFDNLDIQNNTYNYKGKEPKIKFTTDEAIQESNDEMSYPAEYIPTDWNKSAYPMSGRPFTIVNEKNWVLSKAKGGKLTLKNAYITKNWNENMDKKKVIQINMAKKKSKKGVLLKQRVQPVIIKGKENNWNNVIKRENDSNLHIEKTEKINNNNFNIIKGDEVHISNEAEEILVNDDYNIVEENYTRPIRANIRKIQEYSEESKSSEYDVLKGIEKYQGQIIYKDLINESLRIHGQKVIINDISGKYPRRVETFQGLDENYQKLMNDQNQKKNINIKINMMKKTGNQNIDNVNVVNKRIYVEQKRLIKKEIANDHPIIQQQQKNIVFTVADNPERKIIYEPEHENEPEDEQEPEGEIEEQENMDVPEDKDHVPEEKNDSNQQPHAQSQDAEDNNEPEGEQEQEQEGEMEEQGENEEPENENENMNNNNEVEEQQRKYVNHQIETQEQYYYLKQSKEKEKEQKDIEESPKNQNEIENDEPEHEQENENEQNEEEEVKDSQPQNAEESPKSSVKNVILEK